MPQWENVLEIRRLMSSKSAVYIQNDYYVFNEEKPRWRFFGGFGN